MKNINQYIQENQHMPKTLKTFKSRQESKTVKAKNFRKRMLKAAREKLITFT